MTALQLADDIVGTDLRAMVHELFHESPDAPSLPRITRTPTDVHAWTRLLRSAQDADRRPSH